MAAVVSDHQEDMDAHFHHGFRCIFAGAVCPVLLGGGCSGLSSLDISSARDRDECDNGISVLSHSADPSCRKVLFRRNHQTVPRFLRRYLDKSFHTLRRVVHTAVPLSEEDIFEGVTAVGKQMSERGNVVD